jgi:hypothetical protein
MWCWIRCWSTPDSHEAEWKDQPRAAGWGNVSHFTRLLPYARIDYPTQYRWEISQPLISIIRLLPSTISNTRFKLTLGGCPTSQTIVFMTTSFKLHTRRVFMDQRAVYIDQIHQQIQPDSHQKKGSEQWQKVKMVKWPHVKLQCTRTTYSKEYSNIVRPVTMLPLLRNSQPATTSDKKTLKDSSYLNKLQKDPSSEFFS